MSHIHTNGPCSKFIDARTRSKSVGAKVDAASRSRTLILCFDGTSDKYDKDCTNVVKLFSLFTKDHVDEQLCYYQAGIGTYTAPGFMSSIGQWVAKTLDMAVAWYLYQHILDGYLFLMRNYKVGDQICLFGFSRGAYTARALARMLHKVGLLFKDNTEQIPFAYQLYVSDLSDSDKLVTGFKKTFSRHVPIDFVGVWDTVASTGIYKPLPFAGVNTTIKVFRHALALDECRVKFIADYYHEDEQEKEEKEDVSNVFPSLGNKSKITPHKMDKVFKKPDVKEVWFAGRHADVGGGVDENEEKSPSDISLRWMVQEIVRAGINVIFDEKALKERDILPTKITSQPTTNGPQPQDPETNSVLINRKKGNGHGNQSSPNDDCQDRDAKDVEKVGLKTKIYTWIHDQLRKTLWNFLEYSPTTFSTLDENDKRIVKRWCFHRWSGRRVPSHHYFHKSVEEGIKKGYYAPKAEYKDIMGYLPVD
ncbi:hypothetical protein EDB84DRAFT_111459 [Lactarius hengduanensis]|nr:hypothetical protein EDB84DRAFT_111459 [Lactarius hengduanensis]